MFNLDTKFNLYETSKKQPKPNIVRTANSKCAHVTNNNGETVFTPCQQAEFRSGTEVSPNCIHLYLRLTVMDFKIRSLATSVVNLEWTDQPTLNVS